MPKLDWNICCNTLAHLFQFSKLIRLPFCIRAYPYMIFMIAYHRLYGLCFDLKHGCITCDKISGAPDVLWY